jgi:hypothetical protein
LSAVLAVPAAAADWSGSAGWALRLDDHRVATPAAGAPGERFAPWTQAVTPALAIAVQPLGARVEAAATGRLEVGAPVPGEGLGVLRRGTAAEAHAALAREFAAGLSVAAEGSFAHSRDLLDVDHATVSADADAARWAASARADARSFEAEWRARGWRSDTSTPVDTRSLAWGARAYLLRPATGALFLGAHERRMEREQDVLLRTRTAALGLSRDVVPGLAVTLEIGAMSERLGLTALALRPTAALECASPRNDAGAGWYRVRIARELGTEFESEVGRRAGRASAWARASSTVDLEGSSAASPSVIQRAALGAADTLAAATVLGFEASVARNRSYRGLPLEPIASARVGAWVERLVQPWLTCRAGWDRLVRDGDAVGGVPGFRRSRFEIQIRANAR